VGNFDSFNCGRSLILCLKNLLDIQRSMFGMVKVDPED
jgi:hypothetical protein